MLFPVAALSLGMYLVINVADDIPAFDLTPSCQAVSVFGSAFGHTLGSCLESEQRARDALQKQWSQYTPADQDRCLWKSIMSGAPTYSEIAACLKMRDAWIPLDDKDNPSGRGRETSGFEHSHDGRAGKPRGSQ